MRLVEHGRKTCDRQIRRFGGRGYLRRSGVDRPCIVGIIDYKPGERGLVNDGSRRALISALDPDTGAVLAQPPDHEQDLLVFAGEVMRIVAPVTGPRTTGSTEAILYECEVQYDSPDAS